MRRFNLLFSLAALALIVSCGSVETVDSAKVPYKRGISSPTPVQDVYQAYSLAFSTAKNNTFATAQFRVSSKRGDTIRYSNPDQVKFRGKPLEIIDGTKVNRTENKTFDIIFGVLFGPILEISRLFKSGTFFQLEYPMAVDGVFEFKDDLGNRSEIEAKIPRFRFPNNEPVSIAGLDPTSSFVIDIQALEGGKFESLTCTLTSNKTDEQGTQKETSSSVVSQLKSNFGQCSFSPYHLLEHRKSKSGTELILELKHDELRLDSNGRKMQLTTLHRWSKKLNK